MILDRPVEFACDRWESHGCFNTIHTEQTVMRAARAEARRAGWKSTAAEDLCPSCRREPSGSSDQEPAT